MDNKVIENKKVIKQVTSETSKLNKTTQVLEKDLGTTQYYLERNTKVILDTKSQLDTTRLKTDAKINSVNFKTDRIIEDLNNTNKDLEKEINNTRDILNKNIELFNSRFNIALIETNTSITKVANEAYNNLVKTKTDLTNTIYDLKNQAGNEHTKLKTDILNNTNKIIEDTSYNRNLISNVNLALKTEMADIELNTNLKTSDINSRLAFEINTREIKDKNLFDNITTVNSTSLERDKQLDNNITYNNKLIDSVKIDTEAIDNRVVGLGVTLDNKVLELADKNDEIRRTITIKENEINKVIINKEGNLQKEIDKIYTDINKTKSELELTLDSFQKSIELVSKSITLLKDNINVNLEDLNSRVIDLEERINNNIGEVSYFIGECPKGWIEPKGQENEYNSLTNITIQGNLPDWRGLFIRAINETTPILTVQKDTTAPNGMYLMGVALERHGSSGYDINGEFDHFVRHNAMIDFAKGYGFGIERPYNINYTGIKSNDLETRPKNVSLRMCIRAE